MSNLLKFFKELNESTGSEAPDGYCPNCWGEQEYDKNIRQLYKDKQIDINNHEAHYAFIQDFVVNQLEGIRLKKGDGGHQCLACKRNFKY